MNNQFRIFCFVVSLLCLQTGPSLAGRPRHIDLTVDAAVDMALRSSYLIKHLKMGITRSNYWLKARQAGLKSRVYLTATAPNIQNISDNQWNSELRRNEIVRQNTQRLESTLSISQPVILVGYPTNGYLSLNYRMYRFSQRDDGIAGVDYYNRLYVRFDQPFFLPNHLKNNLEEAELDLENVQLSYVTEKVRIMGDTATDYYSAFEMAGNNLIYESQLEYLTRILEIATGDENNSEDEMDIIQTKLEIANTKENLLENQSNLRVKMADLKQRLRVEQEDSLYITPQFDINPIKVNMAVAVEHGKTLNPQLKRMSNNRRISEIDLDNSKGYNAFNMRLTMTYGLEKNSGHFSTMWDRYDNSNSIAVSAYLPIWDWGQRRARMEAQRMNVKRRDLEIAEHHETIRKNVANAVTNMNEYQARCLNMQESLKLSQEFTELSIDKYEKGEMSLQDLLQSVKRHRETEEKFLSTYLGYKRSVLSLMGYTYYDYENDISLIRKYAGTD